MEKYPKNSLYADCPSRVYGCGRRHPGASMPPNLARAASHKCGSVVAVANARHACPGCAPSRTALPPAPGGGKRTRGVYTEGILLWVFPGCCSNVFLWADLTQPGGEFHWSKPARAKSKRYIPWSNDTGLGGTGALGGSNATGASHQALIHAGWCGGMSEEAGRVSGAWPPSRTAMTW